MHFRLILWKSYVVCPSRSLHSAVRVRYFVWRIKLESFLSCGGNNMEGHINMEGHSITVWITDSLQSDIRQWCVWNTCIWRPLWRFFRYYSRPHRNLFVKTKSFISNSVPLESLYYIYFFHHDGFNCWFRFKYFYDNFTSWIWLLHRTNLCSIYTFNW